MITLSLFVLGPILHLVENGIFDGVIAVLDLPFGLAGLIIGFFNQIIVITGVHHIFNFLEIQLLENLGFNPFNPIVTAAIAAQGGGCISGCRENKIKKIKSTSLSILPVGISRYYRASNIWCEPTLRETIHHGG